MRTDPTTAAPRAPLDFVERVARRIGMIAIACGMLVSVVAGAVLVHRWSWHAGTAVAEGTVVAHEASKPRTGRGSRSRSVAEIVRFTDAAGVEREFTSSVSTSDPFAIGGRVPVRYRTDAPADAAVDTLFRTWGFPAIFVGAGGVMAAFGLVFLRSRPCRGS